MTNPVMPATGVPLDGEDIGHPDNPPDSWTQGVLLAGLNDNGVAKHGRFVGDHPATVGLSTAVSIGLPFEVPTGDRTEGQVIQSVLLNPTPGDFQPTALAIETYQVGIVDLSLTMDAGVEVALVVSSELGGIAPYANGDAFDLGFPQLAGFRGLWPLSLDKTFPSSKILRNTDPQVVASLMLTEVDVWAVIIAGAGGYTAPTPDPATSIFTFSAWVRALDYLAPAGS